ncbi:hypothetical protein [Pseudomonas amygdali]|uniref:Uncharacterized protein n=1 Tax=Pseudomonas amygdali pv. lachrymans str. M301315 TaxID=629260 RepID=A0AAD0PVW6_PSEAV|nr:hypothetical protein [Pseudomonas amygdali]AXH59726.1 hypothetical protein PLA107_031380 [Pseudomonas amygdali pv. lachrymans str. M301315]RMT05817.1 hypothetical protein ALP54_03629 [Pseudomonas amygdali pv. lachrymans]
MTKANTIIPLYNHPEMTYALKIGCRDTYRNTRMNLGREVRAIDMRCSSEMDRELLQACVSFLSHEKFDYLEISDKMPARKWYAPKTTTTTHADALMALRYDIAQSPHVPWKEECIHFWSDFNHLYQHLDVTDQLQVDAFFELLMGKSFKDFRQEHTIKSLTPFQPDDGHPYQVCEHVDTLVRSDVARHQFSLVLSSQQLINKPVILEEDMQEYWDDMYDFDYHNPGPSIPVPDYKHRPLEDFSYDSPGKPFAELRECILAAFDRSPESGSNRSIVIRFRGLDLLRGVLTSNGFTPEDIYPQQKLGMSITRQQILDILNDCQRGSHIRVKFDDMLGIDLGL